MAKIYVLTGGPCTGKTTLLERFGQDYNTIPEGVIETLNTTQKTYIDFERKLFERRIRMIEEASEGIWFSDRSPLDNLAYLIIKNKGIPRDMLNKSKGLKFEIVFLLEPLGFYETTEIRQSPAEMQERIHQTIHRTYEYFGYNPIMVPAMPVEERINFILSKI